MSPSPRRGTCVACGRYAGRYARVCVFCGERVYASRALAVGRWLAPAAGALCLLAGTISADPQPALHRFCRATTTPAGAALLVFLLAPLLVPPPPLRGPLPMGPSDARMALRRHGCHLLAAAACAWAGLLALPPMGVAAAWAAAAAACFLSLTWLHGLSPLPLAALAVPPLAVALTGGQ